MSKLTWVPAGEAGSSTWVPGGVKHPSAVRVSTTGAVNAKTSPWASQGVVSIETARIAAPCGSVKEQVAAPPAAVALVQVRSAVGACSATGLVTELVAPPLSVTVKVAL